MYLQEELETVDIWTGIGPERVVFSLELIYYIHMRSECKQYIYNYIIKCTWYKYNEVSS